MTERLFFIAAFEATPLLPPHRIILSEVSPITRSPTSVKQMAALGSIGSALVLVALKVFLAVATGSLGVLSEALHSGLDLIAAILTWLSVQRIRPSCRFRAHLRPRKI